MDTGVQFDEPQFAPSPQRISGGNSSKIVDFLIRKGFVKDKKTASIVLLSIVAVFVLVSLFIFMNSGSSAVERTVDPTTDPTLIDDPALDPNLF